jgi:hypothetical protein
MTSPAAVAAVLVGVVTVLPVASFAQTMKLRFGAQVGVNLARSPYEAPGLVGSDIVDDKYRVGFVVGGTATLVLPGQEMFSFESGFFLQTKGGTTAFTFDTQGSLSAPVREPPYEYNWKLSYLTVPLLAKASVPVGSLRAYVKAGVEASILLSAQLVERYRYEFTTGGYEVEIDIKDRTATGDAAPVLGAGVEIPLGRIAAFAEVSYAHGLVDVLEFEGVYSNANLFNRVISLTAGVRL